MQVGCVLLQEHRPNCTKRPNGYCSSSFAKAKQTYYTTQQKNIAIEWSVLLLRMYLDSMRFTIPEANNLRWRIMMLAGATGRLAWWRLLLSEFDFKIVHCAGVRDQTANVLSHLFIGITDNTQLKDELSAVVIASSDMIDDTTFPYLH